MTKTALAFLFSAERVVTDGKLYFWTWTFREVLCDEEAKENLRQALKELTRRYPTLCGLRVVEVHAGGHGLHYHLIVNRYIPVWLLRTILRHYGFGRIQVALVPVAQHKQMIEYLCKYLRKDFEQNASLAKGTRRWAKFGDWDHCRVKDVKIDTPLTRNMARCKLHCSKLTFRHFLLVQAATMRYGDFPDCTAVLGAFLAYNGVTVVEMPPRAIPDREFQFEQMALSDLLGGGD